MTGSDTLAGDGQTVVRTAIRRGLRDHARRLRAAVDREVRRRREGDPDGARRRALGAIVLYGAAQLAMDAPARTAAAGATRRPTPAAFRAALRAVLDRFGALAPYVDALAPDEPLLTATLDAAAAHDGGAPDALAWLYQYLVSAPARAARTPGAKTEGRALLAATQFFTEPYMVDHLVIEALGPAVAAALTEGATLRTLRVVDPACGGGNLLAASFDFVVDAAARAVGGPGGGGKNRSAPLGRTVRAAREDAADALAAGVLVGYDLDAELAHVAAFAVALRAARVLGELPASSPAITGGPGARGHAAERGFLDPDQTRQVADALAGARRRVVLTNPPFLGRRMMSVALREYLRTAYPEARGDLCAAFVQRCLDLLEAGDRVGLVHQANWLHLSSFAEFRARVGAVARLDSYADLGTGAFADLSGEKTRVGLSVLERRGATAPGPADVLRPRVLSLVGLPLAEKAAALSAFPKPERGARVPPDFATRVRPGITALPMSSTPVPEPVSGPWRTEPGMGAAAPSASEVAGHMALGAFGEGLGAAFPSVRGLPTYGVAARPMQGTSTGDNVTRVRYGWECAAEASDWVSVSKGGGHSKWQGLNRHLVWWGAAGERVREHPGAALRNADRMDATQLVYCDTGLATFSVRLRMPGQVFMASGPGIAVEAGDPLAHLALLNTRAFAALVRALTPKLTVAAGYLKRVPIPEAAPDDPVLAALAKRCLDAKRLVLREKATNDEYRFIAPGPDADLDAWLDGAILRDLAAEADRLDAEWAIETRVEALYDFSPAERDRLLTECGRCAAEPHARTRAVEAGVASLPTAPALDAVLAGVLDGSAQYRPGGRRDGAARVFGREGPLAALVESFGDTPGALLARCQTHVRALAAVRALYLEDLLHRAALDVLGYTADRRWEAGRASARAVVEGLAARLPTSGDVLTAVGIRVALGEWLTTRLPAVHGAAFLGRPALFVSRAQLALRRPLPPRPFT